MATSLKPLAPLAMQKPALYSPAPGPAHAPAMRQPLHATIQPLVPSASSCPAAAPARRSARCSAAYRLILHCGGRHGHRGRAACRRRRSGVAGGRRKVLLQRGYEAVKG